MVNLLINFRQSAVRCRVGRGWAKWPSLRPLDQTARAVFPQAAFLCCAFMASSLDKTRNQMDQAY
jgi:hypothetical protein